MSLTSYFKETRAELHHVNWPSRAQAVNYTAVVVGLAIGLAVLLGAFDLIFNLLLKLALPI